MNATMPRLSRGERAPDFVLPCPPGNPTRFYGLAGGKPTLLLFSHADDIDALVCLKEALNACAADAVSLFAVMPTNPARNPQTADRRERCFPIFADTAGTVRRAYRLGADEKSTLFVLSPNLRVLASLVVEDAVTTARQVISILDASLPRVEPLEIKSAAPVLPIPDVLDPETCRELIAVWKKKGHIETGVEQSRGGRRRPALRDDIKRRRDHIVRDETLIGRLSTDIGGRVMPEVYKAFAFRASGFEGFKIVCYDAAVGGFFAPHRDNLSPSTAHRRFALSLNLNTDYTGGHLRFPEYGPHLYRPGAGEALVFSCSHLHEVSAVTTGRRFALLSFLFGKEASRPARAKSMKTSAL